MSRQIFLVGLATAIMFTGCLLRTDQPVAEQKSIGRILDEIGPLNGIGGGWTGVHGRHAYRVNVLVLESHQGLGEASLRRLAKEVVLGGSKSIEMFKKAAISRVFGDFMEVTYEISSRITKKMGAFPPATIRELNEKLAMPNPDYKWLAAFLKTNTDVVDDKILARLVKRQGALLDDMAGAVATNHMLADAIGGVIGKESLGLKLLPLDNTKQLASELKVSSKDFHLEEILFPNASDPTAGYKFVQELSGVDIGDEAAHLELMLRRGDDGKFAYQNLSAEEIKALGNPFDKHFTKPILTTDPEWFGEFDKTTEFYELMFRPY